MKAKIAYAITTVVLVNSRVWLFKKRVLHKRVWSQ